ncbi:hypothetical protein JD844_028110 [Phrynosoma platyrhinos]|uniref:FYVE-type domain-containing protein n=1 Tax=Phrynosoma platyrhinos TaxID=52577 RepID=A0ABQ7SHA2_PHRPL|nr:hypothetical protein JD844_028110 [Phrynosoma platyrhinos]
MAESTKCYLVFSKVQVSISQACGLPPLMPVLEGFICPLCMKSHGSAEELFKHYEAVHESGIDASHGGDLSPKRDDITLLRQEVQDLQASLKEERWYSEELKKELEKVQGQRHQVIALKILEADVESLEQQLEESQVEKFNIKQMKDLFEQKAAQLATEIVDLKAKYDEEKSLREAAEHRVATLTQELQKERGVCEDLKTELSLSEKLKKRNLDYTQLEEKQTEESISKKNLQATLNQKDLDCQQLQARLSASEDSLQRLQKELCERGEASQKLKEELSEAENKYQHLKAEFKQLQQQREEKEQHSLQLQNELNQNDLEQVLRQIGDKDQKIQNLEALLQKSKENISLLEKEREDLYAKIQAGEGETAVLNQLQEKNHTLQEQVTQLTEKLKNQSESHKQALENLHEQVQEQKAHLRSSQDRVVSLEATISELNSQLSESKEKVIQLDLQIGFARFVQANSKLTLFKTELLLSAEAAKAAQRADLQNHLDTAQNALQDKQQELNKVNTQLDQVTAKLHDKQEYCTQLEANLKEYKEKHLYLEQKTEELEGQHKEKSCQEARRQLQLQSESIAKEQNELKNSLEKQEGISKQLATELDSSRAQVLQIQGILKEKEKNEQQLQLKVKELKESFDQKKKQNETQQAELKTALLEKAELENKLQQQITLSAQELTTEREKITELQKTYKTTQENMEKLQLDIYGKESELLATRQDLKSIEEKFALAQEELVSNRNQISNHNQLIKELKTVKTTLEQDVSKKEQQLKEQEKLLQEIQKDKDLKEKDLANEKSKTTELQKISNKQEKENFKLKEEAKICKQEFEKEITNLKDAKQLLIKQKLELQGKVDSTNTALEQERKTQEAIKDQFKKREEELKKKCAEIETKLQTEIKEKGEQYKSSKETEGKLNMQITALNENLGTVKKEWQSSQRRVNELEKQTDDLRGEIAVLEATVQNNQDERRVLLERCLKSEGEIEKLQNKLMDSRRKLDDTTAAMQELGRENQSLQIKHTQALNRKWAEDNEVQNCMACGKGFSVTVRRHHCRQCGNIFCAECSSKNALTPSSKKPVRVCDTCFIDLQG